MNIKPLADRVVVKPLEQEEAKVGNIYIPETAKEKPMQGKVVAAGPGGRKEDGSRIAMDVKEGDTVLYAKYAGTEVKIGDQKYLIFRETDVLAIVE